MKYKESKIKETVLFILFMGLVGSLIMFFNFLLIDLIGYGAIYTGIILMVLVMSLILKLYEIFFTKMMSFTDTLKIGFPVFFIISLTIFLTYNYDFEGNVISSYYPNGYFLYSLEEIASQSIPSTLFFALIFTPIYKFINKRKNNKRTTANSRLA